MIHILSGLLKTQHLEILHDLKILRGLLDEPFSRKSLQKIGVILHELDQRVLLHLTQEDQLLYPKLLHHRHEGLRHLGSTFMTEMGNVAGDFSGYIRRWRSEEALTIHWSHFVEESLTITSQLIWRIEREEKELFPLLDAMDWE
ncbi:MAG: hemerythrin domain-containing protein [Magnetococcus sp. THC-1_WYH]